MFKKRTLPLFLIIVCIFHLLTACTININIGNSDGVNCRVHEYAGPAQEKGYTEQ